MRLVSAISKAFAMDDEVWARHANGWSVWSRVATGPFLPITLLSHIWVGWPWAIVLTVLLCIWLWFNPRLFAKPQTTHSWHAKAVMGERVWLNAEAVPIPMHHAYTVRLLSIVSGVGAVLALIAAIAGSVWATIVGTIVMTLGKLWFCDRMVWLYEDMKDATPRYREWLY